MQKNLVIVESPAKAKTIEKFLGKDYKVLSSYGHIRDLKKKSFSIDLETFEPDYEVPAEKAALVNELKKEAKNSEIVWLASDEDREGEAISWHLFEVLKLKPETTKRIAFHEITKTAILKAIETPRDIDINLVNAQQARRVLDRIVGFELSPVLWKKVKPSLSAGRVQSVTVRLVVEREREIHAFVPEASYRVCAIFNVPNAEGKNVALKAALDTSFKTKEEAMDFLQQCKEATFNIVDITTKPLKKCPAPPFTTSTLQQEAARKLGFTVTQTMRIAQQLYESGLITYMRTDSVNLSTLALGASKQAILSLMGEEYLKNRQFATKSKGAQEAHEAIRPAYMDRQKIEGSAQEKRLYDLIWKRTIASQMAEAQIEKTTATISISGQTRQFVATGEVVKFDGFLRVYKESLDDDTQEEEEGMLPPLTKGQTVTYKEMTATERFTQHQPRYNEATLVRKLEELGIGRPSTYAPTISTIQQRGYVEKGDKEGTERTYNILTMKKGTITESTKTERVDSEKGKLVPTDIGTVVNDFLMQNFPQIMDYNFTAEVEKEFDEVAEGNEVWTDMLRVFYQKFEPLVKNTMAEKTEHRVGERVLGTDPASGRQVSVKIGRFGPVAQIGTAEDEEKPRFAQLKKGYSLETITLEEALDLFKLPRTLGEFEDSEVTVSAGRFGPYILHAGAYTSLPKGKDPMVIELDEAIELIKAKREADAKKRIKTFDEEPELEVLDGRFGPYIKYKKGNYKLQNYTPEKAATLTYSECKEIIAKQDAEGDKRPAGRRTRATAAKKATATTKAKAAKAEKTAKAEETQEAEVEPKANKPAKKTATKSTAKKATTQKATTKKVAAK